MNKRARSLSSSSACSSSSSIEGRDREPSPSLTPAPKYHRASPIAGPSTYSFICNLPPTCSQPDTSSSYATEDELNRHQECFHKWVCRTPIRDKSTPPSDGSRIPEQFMSKGGGQRWRECSKVFPEERLLTLHHTETHDPMAREKQERGDKIFECFLPPAQCKKVFLNPARRRRHMIDKHRYPPDYFFAITNHGINRLAEEGGLAFSLIRPRRRDEATNEDVVLPEREKSTRNNSKGSLPTFPPASEQRGQSPPPTKDIEMDTLAEDLSGLNSSLHFRPRGLRKNRINSCIRG